MMDHLGLELRQLSFRLPALADFPAMQVFDGLDFTFPAATITAVQGPSGEGKSTLLRLIAGLERPDHGQVLWQGRDLAAVPVHRRNFGFLFQDGQLFDHLDVAGNIAYGLRLRRPRLARGQIQAVVRQLLEVVSLPGFGSRQIASLSGGQAQRVALARALAPLPEVLLLDEPLSALDQELRESLGADLRSILQNRQITAVYVTHDSAEAGAVADRVVRLQAGKLFPA